MSEAMNGEAVDRVATLAKSAAGIERFMIENIPGIGLPKAVPAIFDKREEGDGLKSVKALVEEWREFPSRRKGTAKVTTLQSFIDLTNRHKDVDGETVIFASTAWPGPSLTSVLNYHELAEEPRFGDHRVQYAFPVTDEFSAWAGKDGQAMSQQDFAAFIEEHAPELADPTKDEVKNWGDLFRTQIATPAKLIELSRGLQVNVAAKAKSAVTLQSGEGEIVFVEEHLNTKGDKLTVPGLFMIALPAFIDGEAVRSPARLRYRVREGSVVWFYQLFRWKQFLRDRVVADLAKVKQATEVPTFEGSPEA
jgi:uncharacterized protein YfdQ (DUF2303 family)